jgi:monofunctional biosynthetic peptidoglycan transglycosylase
MLKTVRKIFLILLLSQLVYIIALRWIDPPFTLTQLGSLFSGDGLKRDYVSFSEMSSEAGLAVMAAEDQLLPDHHGFDFKNIERALSHNEKKPKKIRGASTISQQVAKNVFLWQGRSWLRKGLEVYFTFMIELIWGKQRILEMYLNVIEMGKGIYGIEAAAQEYFNKPALKLNRTQAAMIAASLPNPKKYTVKPVSRYVSIRSKWVIRQMGFLEGDDGIKGLLGKR